MRTLEPGYARSPEDRLIVALDFPGRDEALRFCDRVDGRMRWVKVGLELFTSAGPAILGELRERGLRLFLDLKLHDIPNTVEKACAAAAGLGVSLMTVHAGGGEAMMEAAVRGAGGPVGDAAGGGMPSTFPPRILAVTVLTSLTGDELPGYYVQRPVAERALLLARAAANGGVHGVVTSPHELETLRREMGPGFILLSPGIRFQDGSPGDQKRLATPFQAIASGADYLVIGRPLTGAADPAAAFDRAREEIARALAH
jgi:orotidine-5'-phosphate decarboxylase